MQEEWRPIKEFDGIYEVSSLGRVRSIGRYARIANGNYRYAKGKIKKIGKYPNGYSMVNFTVNGTHITRLVHRLVAQAFIPNPDNLPQVNHKDEDITNNSADNLEWCTPEYNANYGTRNLRCYESNKKSFKPVYQIDRESGMIIRWWESIASASKQLNIYDCQISRVCKGTNNYAGGFVWRYADEYDKERAV